MSLAAGAGMFASRPTQAGTYAIMTVPELVGQLKPDPIVVNEVS